MRRVLGLLAATGLLATIFPAAVAAAPPARFSETETRLLCELSSDAGFVSLYVSAANSGVFASVVIWGPDADPYSDLPTIMTAESTASLDGSSLLGNFELVLFDDPEKAAGMARVAAELTPSGDQFDVGSRDLRDGNRLYRMEHLMQALTVSGSLTLHMFDGTYDEVDLASCPAGTLSSSYFSTNPNAYLTNTDQVFVACQWASEFGVVDLLAIADDFTHFSMITIIGSDRALVGPAVPILTETTYEATYELFDPSTGATVGSADVAAALSPSGERITDHDWLDPYRFNVVGEALTADGTLSLSVDGKSLELPMDDTSCDGGDVRVQVMEKIPHG
jgi:hypothetical protein